MRYERPRITENMFVWIWVTNDAPTSLRPNDSISLTGLKLILRLGFHGVKATLSREVTADCTTECATRAQ